MTLSLAPALFGLQFLSSLSCYCHISTILTIIHTKKANILQQIWSTGRSTVGSGAEAKVHSRNITIHVNSVDISPGDIVFADSTDGVVVIPFKLVDDVIDLIPKLTQADDLVKADVEAGSTVSAAFKKHRN